MKTAGFGIGTQGGILGVHDVSHKIDIESITLDFLRGRLIDRPQYGDRKILKERVLEFFKSHQDLCKPSPSFKKRFALQRKSGGGPDVPPEQEVFATFSPFHLAVIFLAGMKDSDGEKTKLIDILKKRMIGDKEFARDALFSQVDNNDLFTKVFKNCI